MHSNDFVGTLGQGSELSDGDGRSVRCENNFRATELVEIAEDFRFDVELLRGSFDYKVAASKLGAAYDWFNAFERGRFVVRSDLAFGDFAVKVLGDGCQPAIKETLLHIAQNHVVSAAGKHVGNAIAHGSGSNHSDALKVHEGFSLIYERNANLDPIDDFGKGHGFQPCRQAPWKTGLQPLREHFPLNY
jgi:hypothetical protein